MFISIIKSLRMTTLLVILALPLVVQAQFTFTTNNGAITITGYSGPGGTMVIPDQTNGYPVTSIGIWFSGYDTNVTNVVIGRNITNIATGWQNESLSYLGLQAITVDTNNSVYSSSDGVLYDRSRTTLLKCPRGKAGSYTIPDGVTIGQAAFQYCKALTSVTMPNSLTNITDWAFVSCERLTNAPIGPNVVRIGQYAFDGCGALTTVDLPAGLKIIDDYAFRGCGLTSLTIPPGIWGVGNSSFFECESLTSLTLTCGAGDLAFSFCTGLTNLTIAEGIYGVGNEAFAYCYHLTSITLPSTFKSIGYGMFEGMGLRNFTIPSSITSIGDLAFANSGNLTNVVIPDTVTEIGNSAFGGCGLTSLTIPPSVQRLDDWAFVDCYDLTGVYFQGDAPSIGTSVFDYDTNAIAYYLPYDEGWAGPTFGGLPLLPWPGMEASVFLYITNNGAITITRYTGPGGTAVIPDQTNGYPVTSLGTRAFGYNSNLINVVIGRNVTNLGSSWLPGAHVGPFALCFSLQAITVDTNNPVYSSSSGVLYDRSQTTLLEYPRGKIGSYTIPDGVRIIGEAAFSFCNGLTSITMPTSLTNIADMAFYKCLSLTNATIGVYFLGDAPSLGTSVFAFDAKAVAYYLPYTKGWAGPTFGGIPLMPWPGMEATNFTYTINNGTVTITGYSGPRGAAAIPSTIQGLQVTSIGDYAFYFNSNLTSILIPSAVTNIGIGVFAHCTNLTAIVVDTNNPAYTSVTGVLLDRSQTTLLTCPSGKAGSFAIPNGVTDIAESAFDSCYNLTNVTIPNSVTSIGFAAFDGCSNLTNVIIPNSVTSIGDIAFQLCISLTRVTMPDDLTSIGTALFDSCFSLPNVAIPVNVTNIGDVAFAACYQLSSVTIPDRVVDIGLNAFGFCYSLTNVTVGKGVTNLEDQAFQYCTSLTGVYFLGDAPSLGTSVFDYDAKAVAYYLPFTKGWTGPTFGGLPLMPWPGANGTNCTCTTNNGAITITGYSGPGGFVDIPGTINGRPVGTIGSSAFNFSGVTDVAISSNVTNISSTAFYSSLGMMSITVDPNNPHFSSADGLLFNKNQTILLTCPCGKAGTYAVPDSVTNIGDNAFLHCINLTSITIPDSVTSIGSQAFHECYSLTNVTLPSHLNNIGSGLFGGCRSLMNIVIPDSVTNIGDSAFLNCTGLSRVTIPTQVIDLGTEAFSSCTSLTSATIAKSVTNFEAYAFIGCAGLKSIYFLGNPPSLGLSVFAGDTNATIYYLPGTIGWAPTFSGIPTVLWNPQAAKSPNFGVRTNRFGFNIAGSSNLVIVVEACTNLARPAWSPVATNTLTGGASYFYDPHWTNYPGRYYRFRSP